MKIDRKKTELAMAKKQVNQYQLAREMGVTQNCISQLLCRQSTKPSTVGRLAAALDVPVENILEG